MRCNNVFLVKTDSKQSICSTECYYLISEERYKKIKMPKPRKINARTARKILKQKSSSPKFVKVRSVR